MSGAGNTFLVATSTVALRDGLTTDTAGERIPQLLSLYRRADGADVEGVIVVQPDLDSFSCVFYNPDGSGGMLCGNGARCAVRFACDMGTRVNNTWLPFTLNSRQYMAAIDAVPDGSPTITIKLPPPVSEHVFSPGALRDIPVTVYYVDNGSDHVVVSMTEFGAETLTKALRRHEFFPRGVNVNLIEVDDDNIVNIATFERGVEAITGACGTGAVASAIALWRQGRTSDSVTLRPPSRRLLHVTIEHDGPVITSIRLQGDALYDS